MKKYFKILGLPPYASIEQVKSARNTLLKKYHPDYYKGDVKFAQLKTAQINEAYKIIVEYLEKEHINIRNSIRANNGNIKQTQKDHESFKKQEKVNLKNKQKESLKNKVQEEIDKLKKFRQDEEKFSSNNINGINNVHENNVNEKINPEDNKSKYESELNDFKNKNKKNRSIKNFIKKTKYNICYKLKKIKFKIREKKQNKIIDNENEKKVKKKLIKSTLIEDERKDKEKSKFLDFSIYLLIIILGVLIILYFTGAIS